MPIATKQRGRLGRLLAAATLVAAGGSVAVADPAAAAACTTADGVTVVVDYHGLEGRGVQQECDEAGKTARAQFEAHFQLDWVQREPGFVCRVDSAPADDDCVNTPPADAYWSLWWSNGTSGTWTYSSDSVGSLKVPAGGSVAFSWKGSSASSPPSVTPPQKSSSPKPTPQSSPKPTAKPTPSSTPSQSSAGTSTGAGPASGGGGAAGGTSTAPAASAAAGSPAAKRRAQRAGQEQAQARADRQQQQEKADRDARKKRERTASASPSTGATDGATSGPSGSSGRLVSSDPAAAGGDALPVWLAPTGIALLFAAAGATALVRRRRGAGGA